MLSLQVWDRGGGLVVSILEFYSNDLSSNPAGYLNFLCEKTKINEKEAEAGPSLKKVYWSDGWLRRHSGSVLGSYRIAVRAGE